MERRATYWLYNMVSLRKKTVIDDLFFLVYSSQPRFCFNIVTH